MTESRESQRFFRLGRTRRALAHAKQGLYELERSGALPNGRANAPLRQLQVDLHRHKFPRTLFFSSKLQFIKPRIQTTLIEQLIVSSGFNHSAPIDHKDDIGAPD